MTEAEAKTKWCPFAMTGYQGIGLNRFSGARSDHAEGIRQDTRCLGSGCMAWTWFADATGSLGDCGLKVRP